MKKLSVLFLLLNICFLSFGAYLENVPTQLVQPNGEVLNLFTTGDEFYRRVHDADGYSIVPGEDGWYYYAIYDAVTDELVPSQFIVTENRNFELNIPKGVAISHEKYMEKRRAYYEPTGRNAASVPDRSILEDLATRNPSDTQQINNIVICIGFSDTQSMSNNFSYVDGMFNSNAGNNMRDYYATVSYNKLDLESHFYPPADGNVLRFYKDSNPRNYYRPYSSSNTIGYTNDNQATQREHTLLANAVNWVNTNWPVPASLNLDINNDGRCDFISFVIYGPPGGWSDLLWPHMWSLYAQNVSINGKRVFDYNFELDGNSSYFNSSVFCHEGFHVLGSPDLYHYYYYDNISPVGSWDIMESNNLPKPQSMSAYMKYKYGKWISTLPIATINKTYEVFPFYFNDGSDPEKPVIYRIPMTNTTTQYSVVEYRKKTGTNYDNSLQNEGLLIYRINSNMDGNADFNGTNSFDEVYLYRNGSSQTNGVYSNGTLSQAPYNSSNGKTAFNSTTNPKPCQSNGTAENTQNINNILYDNGTDSYTFFYGDPANRTIAVDKNQLLLDKFEGASGAVTVTSNVVWNVAIPAPAAGWLSVSKTKGLNDATLTFYTLSTNSGSDIRSADVTITGNGQTFTVTVSQNVATLDCALFEDFEDINPANPGYAGNTVTSSTGEWLILGYGAMDESSDRYFDTKSIRLRANNSDPANGAITIPGENTTGANVIQMQWDKPNGVGTVSFYYGSFGTHQNGTVFVEYSTDGGTTWISPPNNSVTSPTWASVGEVMQEFSVQINVQGNARIRVIKYKQSGTTNSVNIDNLCITDYSQTGYVSAPVFNPPGGTYSSPINVAITSSTENATIRYTLDGSEPTPASDLYSTPINISSTTTVKAKAWKDGMEPSTTSTAIYTYPINVTTIADFKAANNPATSNLYCITGDVTFVYRSNRNIYIKDATGGLLVFDNATPVITTEYNDGDVIQGGVVGTCTIYNGQYELIPTVNTAVGVPDSPVAPIVITMANLLSDFATYESQLIRIENVTFDEGTFGTGSAGNINIYQESSTMICRNHFGNITDFTPDTEIGYNVTGFAIPFNADRQIAPRNLDDIEECGIQLTGTVTISGAAVFGETLTANADLSSTPVIPDLGEITYQWKRGTTNIGENSETYTLVQADIGNKISVVVTAANCGGSVISTPTEEVIKATQNAPEAPTLDNKTENSITLNEISGCEYRMDESAWQTETIFSGLSPNTTYSFEVRKAETATHFASEPGPSAQFTTNPLGIAEAELNNIHIYGYQNSVYITVEKMHALSLPTVEITDMLGRVVFQGKINDVKTIIPLQVNTGIYNVVLLLQNADEARSVATKVLITKF
ncbi:MAG: M6 family metalloprotease domain-containing protein [Lentimicrobiaceae bacterium]|nr:M6 family metalloprotease domain-containing protein [Lentimicrobiaceae bacterium]